MTAQPADQPALPAEWERMPWSARRRWELRTNPPVRPPDEPDEPWDILMPAEDGPDLTPGPGGTYTREQLLAGNRAQDRWKRYRGPEPTPQQRAAYLAYRATELERRRNRNTSTSKEGRTVGRERPEQVAARERMEAAGVEWVAVRDWAVGSGRWVEREVAVLNVDAVDAYLAGRTAELPPSRFDPMFADPEFWHDLAGQCAVYRRHAPDSFGEALTVLEKGARLFLAAVDGAS